MAISVWRTNLHARAGNEGIEVVSANTNETADAVVREVSPREAVVDRGLRDAEDGRDLVCGEEGFGMDDNFAH